MVNKPVVLRGAERNLDEIVDVGEELVGVPNEQKHRNRAGALTKTLVPFYVTGSQEAMFRRHIAPNYGARSKVGWGRP
jgi:hypothetical protein